MMNEKAKQLLGELEMLGERVVDFLSKYDKSLKTLYEVKL